METTYKSSDRAALTRLPPELILPIAEMLGLKDASRLSRTCRHLHNLLQRDVFVKLSWFPHEAMVCACSSFYRYTPPAIIDRALTYRVPEHVNTVLTAANNYVYGTPLELAVQVGRASTVAHLLSIGADPNTPAATTIQCSTILGSAIACFNTDCCKLVSGTYYQDELRNAGRVIRLLLEGGADPAAPFIQHLPRNRGEVPPILTPLPWFVNRMARTMQFLKKPGSRPGHMMDEMRQFVKAIIAELLARGASMVGVDQKDFAYCHEA
jgi:hypothetical protein